MLEEVEDVNKEKAFCRFCWSNDRSSENPLISACKCAGGVRFIHFECLKSWLKTKLVVQSHNNVKSYYWKDFHCEICRHQYSLSYFTNGRKYELFQLEIPR